MSWEPWHSTSVERAIVRKFGNPYNHHAEYSSSEDCYRVWIGDELYRYNPYCDVLEPYYKEPYYTEKPTETNERMNTMNLSTAVFLINDDVRAVLVTYEVDTDKCKAPRTLFKTFDKSIKVDDYVVVPTDTRHNLTVCKVVEVDVDVDFDSTCQVKWLVGRVDFADVNQIKEQEDQAIEAIKKAEKLNKKKELQSKMKEFLAQANMDMKALEVDNPAGPADHAIPEPVKAE